MKQTILIADKDLAERRGLEQHLRTQNYEVISIEEGREVLEFLRKQTPDLVLVDVDLAYISGLDICTKMKKIKRLSHIPVVIMMPHDHDPRQEMLKVIKAEGMLAKPIQLAKLSQLIKDLIQQKEAESQQRDTLGNTMIIDHALAHLQANSTNSAQVSDEAKIKMLETENKYLRKQVEELDKELESLRKLVYSQQLEQGDDKEHLFDFGNTLDGEPKHKKRGSWLINVFGN
ncbi:MAG: response regulator [Deinococcales bacterium]